MDDGDVGFDAAALVAQLGVDRLAGCAGKIVGGDAVERSQGTAAR